MTRSALFVLGLMALMTSGCYAPLATCSDCNGDGYHAVAGGPLDAIRNARRRLICGGGGCGEVYVGEWISTPPDCTDPCCGDHFVGGAVKARPFQVRPRDFIHGLSIYGRRHCDGNASSAPCGCGVGSCDGGCGEDVHVAGPVSSGHGCSTCRSGYAPSVEHISNHGPHPSSDPVTAARARRVETRARQIRR